MLFHQKKYKNLFEGIIDFHNHILPGIDDGSQSLEESLKMLDMYAILGIEKVMASPHIYRDLYPNTAKSINNSFSIFEEASKNHQVSLMGYTAEYMIDEFFLRDVSSQKELLKCFGDYILVEIPFFGSLEILNQALFALQTEGYIPILAHPERYNSLKTLEEVKKIKRKGAMLQLNALSIEGFYGKETQKKARLWLTNGLYDFVCTDAHNVNQLKKLEDIRLSNKELKAWRLICQNQQHVISAYDDLSAP
jgi:protein-tyrosine phosphatase